MDKIYQVSDPVKGRGGGAKEANRSDPEAEDLARWEGEGGSLGQPLYWRDMFKGVPHLMKTEELAEVLRLSPKTVYGWVEKGKIPYNRRNGVLRFVQALIIPWLEEGNYQPRASSGGSSN